MTFNLTQFYSIRELIWVLINECDPVLHVKLRIAYRSCFLKKTKPHTFVNIILHIELHKTFMFKNLLN